MSEAPFLPDLTIEAELQEARAGLALASTDKALADWARRYAETALNTIEDCFSSAELSEALG